MNARVWLGKTKFTVRGADHLHVSGELVEIQRACPNGYETLAVAGDDLLVTIESDIGEQVEPDAAPDRPMWYPVGEPMD